MKKIRMRDGEPPLRYLLEPRYNRIGRMRNKIVSIGKSILSFFQAWKNDTKPVEEGNNQNKAEVGLNVWQNVTEGQDSSKGQKVIEKAVQRAASRLIRYHDISSSEDESDSSEMKQEPVRTATIKNGEPKPEILLIVQQKPDQAIQYKINNKKQQLNSNKPEQKGPSLFFMKAQVTVDKKNLEDENQDIEGKKRERTHRANQKKQQDQYDQYMVQEQKEDGVEVQGENKPRKRVKTGNQQFLDYVKRYSEDKLKIYQETYESSQKMVVEYKDYMKQEHVSQQVESDSDDDYEQKRQQKSLNNHLQSLTNILDKIKQRKANNLNIENKNQQFTPAGNAVKVRKVKVNIDKVLSMLKQAEVQPQVVVQPTQQPAIPTNNNGFSFSAPPSSSSFNFGSSLGVFPQSSFGAKSLDKEKQIIPEKKITFVEILKEDNKLDKVEINSQPASSLGFNFGTKKIQPVQIEQEKQKPAQKISLFGGLLAKKSEEKPKETQSVAKEPKKQQAKISFFGDAAVKKVEVKQNSESQSSLSPSKIDNPFLKKPEPNRNILPELFGIGSSIFSNSNVSSGSLFSAFQKKSVVAEGTPDDKIKQQAQAQDKQKEKEIQKSSEQNNIFSTPTKNIFEKYPDMQPKPLVNQVEEEQGSMFDESENDKSTIKVDQLQQSQVLPSIFGQASSIQNFVNLDSQKQLFLNSIPGGDPNKSLEIFGKSSNNQGLNLFAPSSSEKKKDLKPPLNKKKTKQQRAYG